jgi:chromosomal replication initiator protein
VDLLVIDDIHDLSKRDRTQEEFFHTFNSLYQTGRQIILSSDAPPNEIPDLEERLISRFNCGLVARIEKPCFETRVAIVKSKAALRNLRMPDDVASYIAAKIDTNIRELEGAITKIQGLALINNAPFSLDLAKQAIGEPMAAAQSTKPSMQQIIDAVTGYYGIKLTDLLSKRRHKSIALPRQVGMWLARKHTRYSLEEIGSYFGGRDHTTVMHAIRMIETKRDADSALDLDVSRLEEQIATRAIVGIHD